MARSSTKPNAKQKQTEETGLQSLASICTTLAVGIFAMTFIAQNFFIPSASMASTILVGDHVVADTSSLAPAAQWASFMPYRPLQRGEPVVFHKPMGEPNGEYLTLVKRVIALPGDRIHLRGGVVYLNGVAQNEPYAAKIPDGEYDAYRDDFPAHSGALVPNVSAEWALDLPNHIQGDDLVVPPDCYFMMGDNRGVSLDSRYWGFVGRANLIGRPLFVYWSFATPGDQVNKTSLADQIAFAAHTALHFFDDTRWRRTLHRIR